MVAIFKQMELAWYPFKHGNIEQFSNHILVAYEVIPHVICSTKGKNHIYGNN